MPTPRRVNTSFIVKVSTSEPVLQENTEFTEPDTMMRGDIFVCQSTALGLVATALSTFTSVVSEAVFIIGARALLSIHQNRIVLRSDTVTSRSQVPFSTYLGPDYKVENLHVLVLAIKVCSR